MGYKFKTPCIVCGKLAVGNNKCELHQAEDRLRAIQRLNMLHETTDNKAKYGGDYRKRAKEIKRLALEQGLDCPICGKPLALGGQIQADHIYPQLGSDSPLQAVHRACNLRKSYRPPSTRGSSPGVGQFTSND